MSSTVLHSKMVKRVNSDGNDFHYCTSVDGSLTHILIAGNEKVFVGGQNILLRFSSDLDLEDSISTKDTCSGNDCDKESPNHVSILDFYPFHNRLFLLFCGTNGYGICKLYNMTDFGHVVEMNGIDNQLAAHYLGSKTSAIAVPILEGSNKGHIHSAMDYDGRKRELFPKVFSVRRTFEHTDNLYLLYADHYSSGYATFRDDQDWVSKFDFKYGFHHDEYTYFLRNTKDVHTQAYIAQACSGLHYSYVETELTCGRFITMETAFFWKNGTNSALYVVFSSSMYSGTILCMYTLSVLQEKFRKAKEDCFLRGVGSTPDWINGTTPSCQNIQANVSDFTCGRSRHNTRIKASTAIRARELLKDDRMMTSVEVVLEDLDVMVYIGINDGTLIKYLMYENLRHGNVFTTLFTKKTDVDGKTREIRALTQNNNRLYFTMGNKVGMLKTDNCHIHTTCIGCLSDAMSCQWCPPDSTKGGKCTDLEDSSCGQPVDKYVCRPEIHSVTPLSGPLEGGTKITLTGSFGDMDLVRGNYSFNMADLIQFEKQTSNRVVLLTKRHHREENIDIIANLIPGSSRSRPNIRRPVLVIGTAKYKEKFSYREPRLLDIEPKRCARQGHSIMVLHGKDLDIGSYRYVFWELSNSEVILNLTSTKLIVAMPPDMRIIGRTHINYTIDRARLSYPLEIVDSPTIESVDPNITIKSGGISVTITGRRLDGMGNFIELEFDCDNSSLCHMEAENRLTKESPSCLIYNETTMVCHSPPWNAVSVPAHNYIRLKNRFGPFMIYCLNNDSSVLNIIILEDPVLDNLTETLHILKRNSRVRLTGSKLNNVKKGEITVTIGSLSCIIYDVTDMAIMCGLTIPPDIMFDDKVAVKVKIGNILWLLGYAIYQEPNAQLRQQAFSATRTNMSVLVISIIGAFVVTTILVALGMKRLGIGPFKTRRAEQYEVSFRNGGSDVLTLDGLSENHATDISQNRQNAYQEQTFLKQGPDGNSDMCTEPLLPNIDENLRRTLERQALLIDRESIILGEIIGQGHFGCVYKAYLRPPGEKKEKDVAAKTLSRKNPKDVNVDMFLKEALIMKDFQHTHVIELIGICIGLEELPLVILPYMEHGDLLTYLRDAKNVPTVKDLVTFGVDIANGMCYLSELKFLHRDLAARNCMMDDNYCVKVADFGLSRDVYEKEYYSSRDKTTKLPVKWMAPESLDFGMYSSKSDVWSYGVVLWELVTRGVNPYPEVDNWDILRYLELGRRMPQPSYCPEELYAIMQRCWSWEPNDRPAFGELAVEIPAMLRQLEHPVGERGGRINIETTYVNFSKHTVYS